MCSVCLNELCDRLCEFYYIKWFMNMVSNGKKKGYCTLVLTPKIWVSVLVWYLGRQGTRGTGGPNHGGQIPWGVKAKTG